MFKKTFWGDVMETRVIQWCTYQKNIDRYKGLFKTKLSETERRSLEKQLFEETMAMLQFSAQAMKQAVNSIGHSSHAVRYGPIMTKFDIIGACVTLFLLGVFVYVVKREV